MGFAYLRETGYTIAGYIDDMLNIEDSAQECIENAHYSIKVFIFLGFTIHLIKSDLNPSKGKVFLGFIINSEYMIVENKVEKSEKVLSLCKKLLSQEKHTIRFVAKVVGTLISTFPAVKYGPLYYRNIDMCKNVALKQNNGKFSSKMSLNKLAKDELSWWINNIAGSFKEIYIQPPSTSIQTDASKTGWGAVWDKNRVHGHWNFEEQDQHINVLELRAILFAVKSFEIERNSHIKVLCDNTTAVQVINKMGTSHSPECNEVCSKIWTDAINRDYFISSTHIPGKFNPEADKESRKHISSMEWMLNPKKFDQIIKFFGITPNIDLFASRINYQIKPFASFRADPESAHVNSYLLCWSKYTFYAFPPFNQIAKTLRKIEMDKASGIIIVPDWPNQIWYARLKHVAKNILFLSHRKDLLILPTSRKPHPLYRSLNLMAILV